MRVTVLTILVLLSGAAAGQGSLSATYEPMPFTHSRVLDPEILAMFDDTLIAYDRANGRMGRLEFDGRYFATGMGLDAGERLSVKTMVRGPDGDLWFAGIITENQNERSVLGHMDFEGGNVVGPPAYYDFDSEDFCTRLSAPCRMVSGPLNSLWLTGGATGKMARATTSGVLTEFPVSASTINGIAPGSDGDLWVTSSSANRLYEVNPSGIVLRSIRLGGTDSFYNPGPITPGPDGALYVLAQGGNAISRVTTAGVETQFPIPAPNGTPYALAFGSNDLLYFTEYFGRNLGQLDPATGAILKSAIPGLMHPDEVLGLSPDGQGNIQLVLNTIDQSTGDSTPVRVRIADQPSPDPKARLDLTMKPYGNVLPIPGGDATSPRQVRAGNNAEFLISVLNVGSVATTPATAETPGWHLLWDRQVAGFSGCHEKVEGEARLIETNNAGGDIILTPQGASAVLDANEAFQVTIQCPVVASVSGSITNTISIEGGGVREVSASASAFALLGRSAIGVTTASYSTIRRRGE